MPEAASFQSKVDIGDVGDIARGYSLEHRLSIIALIY